MATKPTKSVYLPPVRVREDLRDQLRTEAERRQTGVTTLIREAIIDFLSPKKGKTK